MDEGQKIVRTRFLINLVLFSPIIFTPYFKSLIEKEFEVSSWTAFFIFMGIWTVWYLVMSKILNSKRN